MKLIPPIVAFATCAALVFSYDAVGSDEGEQESPLHQAMERIERGLKKIRREVKDAKSFDASLEAVVDMQNAAGETKLMTPPITEKQPEAERAAFVKDYRKRMIAVQKDLLDLEIALLDGDAAKAQELVKKVSDAEDSGHEKFTEDG